jgi:hypothetical protein
MTGKLNYTIGDATEPEGSGVRFVAHICNNIGGWGRGFVTALSKRNKNPENCYRRWFADGVYEGAPFELGQIQMATFTPSNVVVANMIAQDGIRRGPGSLPAVSYQALRDCLDRLGYETVRWHDASGTVPTIHMPRIGCGLGGGNWDIVEESILACLVDVYELQVTVYDLKEKQEKGWRSPHHP